MSAAAWRTHFSYNAYSLIAGRALARSLNETARVSAEKRGLSALKFQTWEAGKSSEAQWINPPKDAEVVPKSAAV
ncbi:ATP synthase epsilon chain domain-containing protein [Ceratobasidium sp. AG-Ba]|nr:ATP synthase epsilon chain domain-containing protein [Ceratobasidium sp. AG-Ba]